MRLREPEPMIVAEREGHVGALEMLDGRHDVEHGQLLDAVGKVEGQAMGDAGAAIVRADQEPLMPEALHHLDHVLGHLLLGVGRVVGRRLRLERAAVAPQVRADDA